MAWQSWYGETGHGASRLGVARQGKAVETCIGEAWQARRGKAVMASQGETSRDEARQSW